MGERNYCWGNHRHFGGPKFMVAGSVIYCRQSLGSSRLATNGYVWLDMVMGNYGFAGDVLGDVLYTTNFKQIWPNIATTSAYTYGRL